MGPYDFLLTLRFLLEPVKTVSLAPHRNHGQYVDKRLFVNVRNESFYDHSLPRGANGQDFAFRLLAVPAGNIEDCQAPPHCIHDVIGNLFAVFADNFDFEFLRSKSEKHQISRFGKNIVGYYSIKGNISVKNQSRKCNYEYVDCKYYLA